MLVINNLPPLHAASYSINYQRLKAQTIQHVLLFTADVNKGGELRRRVSFLFKCCRFEPLN